MSPKAESPSPLKSLPPIRQVTPTHVMRWLRLGWNDFTKAGWPSLLHGLIVFTASIAIIEISLLYWPILPGAVSGFVLVGPILATGLYAVSRQVEQREQADVAHVVAAWRQGSKCLARFGFLLLLAGAGWVAMTTLLFSFFVDADISEPKDFLLYVFVQQEVHFMLWALLGGLGCALLFGLSVVSVPLLLDRDVTMPAALKISIKAVGENPITMTWWAIIIMLATGLSIATLMIGFIVLYPLIGHASWHAYRDMVDVDGLTPRKLAV